MKKLIVTALAIGIATALQPSALAQFGSGVVFDPTQAGHAVTQIKNEEASIANEVHQIEQGQQIFTNTVKIATRQRCRADADCRVGSHRRYYRLRNDQQPASAWDDPRQSVC